MQLTKTHKIVISVIIILVLFDIYITFDNKSKEGVTDVTDNNQISTTTDSNGLTDSSETKGYKIEPVEFEQPKPLPSMPDLNRPIVIYSGVTISPEAKSVAEENVKLLQEQLKSNSKNWDNWINLGIYQKMAGDYDGAVLSWKYARALSPTDYVSVANLGNLYAYFLKDNGMAETYYKEAISKGPLQPYLYTQLAEIYRDVF